MPVLPAVLQAQLISKTWCVHILPTINVIDYMPVSKLKQQYSTKYVSSLLWNSFGWVALNLKSLHKHISKPRWEGGLVLELKPRSIAKKQGRGRFPPLIEQKIRKRIETQEGSRANEEGVFTLPLRTGMAGHWVCLGLYSIQAHTPPPSGYDQIKIHVAYIDIEYNKRLDCWQPCFGPLLTEGSIFTVQSNESVGTLMVRSRESFLIWWARAVEVVNWENHLELARRPWLKSIRAE